MKVALLRIGIVAVVCLAIALFYPDSPISVLKKPAEVDGKTVRQWMVELNSPDPMTVRMAIRAIGKLGEDGEPALDQLARILITSPDEELRKETAHSLQKMAPISAKVVDSLVKAVKDESVLVRMHALLALVSLKHHAGPALDTLLIEVKEPKSQERAIGFTTNLQETMLVAIGYASKGREKGVPVLLEYLNQDQNPNLKYAAMRGLAVIGEPAKSASQELRKILKDPKSPNELRQEAFDALAQIGDPASKTDLVFVDPGPAIMPKGATPPGGKGPPGGGKGFSPDGKGKGKGKGPGGDKGPPGEGKGPNPEGANKEGKGEAKEGKDSKEGTGTPK